MNQPQSQTQAALSQFQSNLKLILSDYQDLLHFKASHHIKVVSSQVDDESYLDSAIATVYLSLDTNLNATMI